VQQPEEKKEEVWSHSRIATAQRCARQFKYIYRDHLTGPGDFAAMKRGNAVDAAFNYLAEKYPDLCDTYGFTEPEYLVSIRLGKNMKPIKNKKTGKFKEDHIEVTIPELAAEREIIHQKILAAQPGYEPDLVEHAAEIAIHGYATFARKGYRIARDVDGKPLVQVNLFGRVGETLMRGYADFIAEHMKTGERTLFDGKATGAIPGYTEGYVRHAPQTAIYKILAPRQEKRIGRIDRVGFFLMGIAQTKRQEVEVTVPAKEISDEIIKSITLVRARVRLYENLDYWPREVKAAHESPCKLCDFAAYCLEGNAAGIRPSDRYPSRDEEAEIEWY